MREEKGKCAVANGHGSFAAGKFAPDGGKRHPVAVVYSYKGKVVWMKKSRKMDRYMIDWKDLDVPKNSVTEEFFQYGVVYDTNDIQDVDLDVWFKVSGARFQGSSHDSWRSRRNRRLAVGFGKPGHGLVILTAVAC